MAQSSSDSDADTECLSCFFDLLKQTGAPIFDCGEGHIGRSLRLSRVLCLQDSARGQAKPPAGEGSRPALEEEDDGEEA
eukprot:855955-Rhodomonas_salina.1